MNRLRQYQTPLLTSLLAAVFLVVPQVAFANFPGETFFQQVLWTILVTITGTVLWICAMLFDFAVNTFVIGFGDLYLGSGIGLAVDRIWFILRDFVNMFFIFGLVYIGFKMILDADNSNTRRWLVNLIIAAILINFSLFITKAVVDFSNQIATQIAISGFPDEGVTKSVLGSTPTVDLSDYILRLMGIKDLLGLNLEAYSENGGWGYIFGTAIFFLVTAFVLAAGAFLLIARFIALTLFILVSPLMFMSWVLPPISDTMERYWKAFLGRAFFAPIYFLFLYFSLETLVGLQQSLNTSGSGGKWAETFAKTGAGGNAQLAAGQSTLPYFFVMCGFMIASLMIAQKLGADGAGKALDYGKSLKNKAIGYTKKGAGAVTLGVGARVGRSTVGRGANALASNPNGRLQKWAAQGKFGSRTLLNATRGVADSSFDARSVGGVGKALGIGEGKKGGFTTRIKERVEKDEKFAKSLDDTDIETTENAARVKDLEAKKAREAKESEAAADEEVATLGAITENSGKTFERLDTEIVELTDEIEDLGKALNEKVTAGTITTQERGAAEAVIANKTAEANRKRLASTEFQKVRLLQNKINSNGFAAANTSDPVEAARLREEEQRFRAELQARQDVLMRRKNANDAKTQAEADIKNAEEEAKLEIKYENKIAFIETAKRKKTGVMTIGGRFNAKEQASFENLQKKFGKDAKEMKVKAAQTKADKELVKRLKELEKDNEEGKKKKENEDNAGGDS